MHDEDDDKDTQDELVHDSLLERDQVARYLRAIADGVEAGVLRLSSGENELELHPPGLCGFELRARAERNRVKLRLRLAWRKTDERTRGAELLIQTR